VTGWNLLRAKGSIPNFLSFSIANSASTTLSMRVANTRLLFSVSGFAVIRPVSSERGLDLIPKQYATSRFLAVYRTLKVMQRLFQSPPIPKHHSSLHLNDAIVSAGLDDLTIQTRWLKDSSDDSLVKSESIRDDQGNLFEIHSTGKVSKEGERVLVAPFS
jgi:hypothetical protein